ncbi:MAG: hypothetical protein AAFS12_06325, partial [Cyanobacteria bacterium J06632_19]
PGAGKTTMLLKLAEELVERAKEDSTKAVPVLFSLPTWNSDKQSIKDWLIEQLKEKYGVRKDIGFQWVDSEEIADIAFRLLEKLNAEYAQWIEETRQKVDVAIAELERGEGLDGETVVAEILERFQKARELQE